jgi:hypothetical protein
LGRRVTSQYTWDLIWAWNHTSASTATKNSLPSGIEMIIKEDIFKISKLFTFPNINNGYRPYKCTHCDKAYYRKY